MYEPFCHGQDGFFNTIRKMAQDRREPSAVHVVGNMDWDGLHRPQIYYAMVAIFSGLFLSVIDGTICNVALPTIARQLQISSSDSIWIVNAFQLVVVMTLLPCSALGELFGFKRTYLWGMVFFTVGSLCCALSGSFVLLVLSRMLQGVGAAMVMSVNGSLVRLIYPKRHLAKGFGLNATVVALASVAGPTISGAILSVASWPWLFAVNLPFGVLTFFLARRYLPGNPTRVEGRRFDFPSAVLNALTFGLFIGCVEAFSHGLSFRWIVAGVVLLAGIGTSFRASSVAPALSDAAFRFASHTRVFFVCADQYPFLHFANVRHGGLTFYVPSHVRDERGRDGAVDDRLAFGDCGGRSFGRHVGYENPSGAVGRCRTTGDECRVLLAG